MRLKLELTKDQQRQIAKRLKKLRKVMGWNMEEAGYRLGFVRQTIGMVESLKKPASGELVIQLGWWEEKLAREKQREKDIVKLLEDL